MVCIYCGGKTQVTNSRLQRRLNHVWRRRECVDCGAIFTTEEAADYTANIVIRHSQGPITPFSRDRLFVSLYKSLGHRKTAAEDASALTATIIVKILAKTTEAALDASTMAEICHDTLKHFDKAAAVQYSAYHKL